ncbi:MAG: CPBP family intramembrane glutamic endopeptidase [Bacteroidia bacterium]
MIKSLLELLMHLAIVLPVTVLFMKDRTKETWLKVLLFVIVYIVNQLALSLPNYVPAFSWINSNWNWDGKIYGLLVGVAGWLLLKPYFKENNFFTLQQYKPGFKPALYAVIALTVFSLVLTRLMGSSDFDTETLLFELTMPSLEEEIVFRGVLLGLLSSALKPSMGILGNPAVLITALLFGFVHALGFSSDYSINFDPLFFLMTGLGGFVWGWVTIKSRSILLAYLSHNICNSVGTLLTMI